MISRRHATWCIDSRLHYSHVFTCLMLRSVLIILIQLYPTLSRDKAAKSNTDSRLLTGCASHLTVPTNTEASSTFHVRTLTLTRSLHSPKVATSSVANFTPKEASAAAAMQERNSDEKHSKSGGRSVSSVCLVELDDSYVKNADSLHATRTSTLSTPCSSRRRNQPLLIQTVA